MSTREILSKDENLWSIFTLKGEYDKTLTEEHRSLYTPAVRHDISKPCVSEFLVKNGYRPEYPEGKKFCVCLTHDVDDIYPCLSHTMLSSLYFAASMDYNRLKKQLLWKLKGKRSSPYWNFRDIMRLEEKYEGRSSFYFLSSDVDISRFRYHIEDLENELGTIADMGWEIGLHGDVRAYYDPGELIRQKARLEKVLGKKVLGYRNHYLRFKVPDTWESLVSAGFRYDTTLGYNNAIGFRNGMCHPFRPFNLKSGKQMGILEIPLTVMDGGIAWNKRSFVEVWDEVRGLIDSVERCNGVITLLWHNYVFGCAFRNDWVRLYEKILGYCYARGAWIASGEEIYEWYRKNAYHGHKYTVMPSRHGFVG